MERVRNLTFFMYTSHKMWLQCLATTPYRVSLKQMPMYTFGHQVDQDTNKDQAKGTNNVYVVIYLVCIAPIIYMVEKSSIWKANNDLLNKRIVHQTHCAVVVCLVQTQY